MLHKGRHWGVVLCENADELAEKLSVQSRDLCSAFRTVHGTVWANDSTCEDAIQEYGVLRQTEDGNWCQVESITVSWCDHDKLRHYIEAADAGEFDNDAYSQVPAEHLEDSHEMCNYCG